MYLLNERKPEPPRLSFGRVRITPEPTLDQLRWSPEGVELKLPKLTEQVLEELKTADERLDWDDNSLAGADYWDRAFVREGAEPSARERLEVARAMVIQDREPSLLDGLAVELIYLAISRYAKRREFCISVPTNHGVFSRGEFIRGPLRGHLQPGLGRFDRNSVERLPLHPTIQGFGERVELSLLWNSKDQLLYFVPRGLSRLKRGHLRLISDLNLVLQDYRNRLDWTAEYRRARPLGGLSEAEVDLVRDELRLYDLSASDCDLSGLRSGVSFGDEPVTLDPLRRLFYSRCELCRSVVAMEVIDARAYIDGPLSWTKLAKLERYRNRILEGSFSRVLKEIHDGNGCGGTRMVSSRTGNTLPLVDEQERLTAVASMV